MPDTPKKLPLIEDDSSLGMRLRKGLQQEGYETWLARTGEEGLLQARQDAFDLLILDWMLPDLQGIDVLQLLRAESRRIPILFLTARDEVEDRVLGLDSGADDYLTKPFAFSQLLARIRTLLRRVATSNEKLRHGKSAALRQRRWHRGENATRPSKLLLERRSGGGEEQLNDHLATISPTLSAFRRS
jgi:DNA-binding response OmpR family regulator